MVLLYWSGGRINSCFPIKKCSCIEHFCLLQSITVRISKNSFNGSKNSSCRTVVPANALEDL